MTYAEVIIVGGGPAGSTCAWKLKDKGIEVLLLDKQDFPRSKPCAGWITPRVLRNLELDTAAYPHSLTRFNKLLVHYRGRKFTLPTRQYAIRRIEFDLWLLERAGVPVHKHTVDTISKQDSHYILMTSTNAGSWSVLVALRVLSIELSSEKKIPDCKSHRLPHWRTNLQQMSGIRDVIFGSRMMIWQGIRGLCQKQMDM